MKKGRPGYILSVLCNEDFIETVTNTFFRTTTTIGVRKTPVYRTELERKTKEFTFLDCKLRVKIAYYKGEIINIKPEHDDVLNISKTNNLPVKNVLKRFYREFNFDELK